MNAHCRIKRDCPRWSPLSVEALIAKYSANVPRYTSYPTAPHFHAGVGAEVYRAWLAALEPPKPLSIYIHIPFCDRLCSYCGCHTTVVNRRAPIVDYVDHLIFEILLVSEAIGAAIPVASVHLGGGSPNILCPDDLDRLFSASRRAFHFAEDVEIAAEIDPRILTQEWIDAAARNGLNRASLGVQDVNPEVQKAINRRQPWSSTRWATHALREAGVRSINLDLMYGLPHQSAASVRETINRALEVAPERIALFGYAHVPWLKPNQKTIPEATLPGPVERYLQQAGAAELLARSGYRRIGLDHFARSDDALAVALDAGAVRRNFQGYTTDCAETLLGFGASAIGRLATGYVQNIIKTPQWRAAVQAGNLATMRGIALSEDDRLRGEIIERLMCDLTVDLEGVATRHGKGAGEFAVEIGALKPFIDDGLAISSEGRLTIGEAGRPFARVICALFDRYLTTAERRHSTAV
jgi:oxygen-independent coproporphyrinogen III oxidase